MRWILVASCVLIATTASAEQRLVVGQAAGAVLYWHGHRIGPPYEIEIGFEASPETTWTATYLNGLPVQTHSPEAPPAVDWADPWLTPDQQALQRMAARLVRADFERGRPLHERITREADVLRSEPGLVDSVRTWPRSDDMRIHWRDSPFGGFTYFVDMRTPLTRSDWWREGLESARTLVAQLSRGGMILWSGAHIFMPLHPGLEEEIARFQAGEDVPLSEIRDAKVRAELRSPPPESALVAQWGPKPLSPPPCGLPRAVAQSEARHVALETIASSEALLFARGRELKPPFEFAADCVADPDTTWMALTVNGEVAWRRPSRPVNWIVQRGAPCGRPPDFGMLSFVLRSGGLAIIGADSSIYVPRVRRPEYAAIVDSLRAAAREPVGRY